MQEASEQSLLAKERSIAVQALARIEKVFPGKETHPRDEPPIPICATVGVEAMSEFYKSYWTPPAGKSVTPLESEFSGTHLREGPFWTLKAEILVRHFSDASPTRSIRTQLTPHKPGLLNEI